MSETNVNNIKSSTNPLIVIAAIALILTCLVAIGVMTGIIPSPLANKGTAVKDELSAAPGSKLPAVASTTTTTTTTRESKTALVPKTEPRTEQRTHTPHRAAERPSVGTTQSIGPTGSLAGAASAPSPACLNCGTVSSVRAIKEQGDAGMIGPAAGTAIGGLIGNQIGNGSGKTIATIAGAAVGAGVGTEVERRNKSTTRYVVAVRLNDGSTPTFNYPNSPGVQTGDRVRVVDGRLLHD